MSRLEDEFNDTEPVGAGVLSWGASARTKLAFNVLTEPAPIGVLERVDFFMRSLTTPNNSVGTIFAQLTEIVGDLEVDAEPGTVLATSGTFDVTTLPAGDQDVVKVSLVFSGVEQFELVPETDYMIVIDGLDITVASIVISQPGLDPGEKSIMRTSLFNDSWSFAAERAWWFEMFAADGIPIPSGGGTDDLTGIVDLTSIH